MGGQMADDHQDSVTMIACGRHRVKVEHRILEWGVPHDQVLELLTADYDVGYQLTPLDGPAFCPFCGGLAEDATSGAAPP
jgi:hypothetical protein